jgi:hypothetical protein
MVYIVTLLSLCLDILPNLLVLCAVLFISVESKPTVNPINSYLNYIQFIHRRCNLKQFDDIEQRIGRNVEGQDGGLI